MHPRHNTADVVLHPPLMCGVDTSTIQIGVNMHYFESTNKQQEGLGEKLSLIWTHSLSRLGMELR